LSISFSTIVF